MARNDFLSLDDVMARAMERERLTSGRDLARKLGVHFNMITLWRRGKNRPSDKLMLSLGAMAGLSPPEALLLLNIWRSKGQVRTIYAVALKANGYHFIKRIPEKIESGVRGGTSIQ